MYIYMDSSITIFYYTELCGKKIKPQRNHNNRTKN